MSLSENYKKIYDLFNKMQKAIIKKFTILNNHLKNNILGKMFLKVLFSQLFEDENNFKNYEEEKAEYIHILIDSIKNDNKIIAKSIIDKKIGQILKEQNIPELGKLIKILKSNANINAELYYLLIIYLKERGFKATDLIENMVLILKDKYPDSIFELTNIDNNDITFNKFINELYDTIGAKLLDSFTIIKFDKKCKKITYPEKKVKI